MVDALFLDFDGVICDSVNECFVSSWIAYHERFLGGNPMAVRIDEYRKFLRLRPLIRSGRDFLVIQEMIAEGRWASSQPEFDRMIELAGPRKMATFDSLLYAVRDELVDTSLEYWLALNGLYGSIGEALHAASGNSSVWIVSTKRPEFISRILGYWRVGWDSNRIVLPVGETKVDVIGKLMEERGYRTGIFVDDQADHLRCPPDGGLDCRLSQWARAGWAPDDRLPPPPPATAEAGEVRTITLEELIDLLGQFRA